MGVVFGKISEELPRHRAVHTAANYTIRHYEPSIAAMCDYRGGWGVSSDGSPFGALARYSASSTRFDPFTVNRSNLLTHPANQ